MNQYDFADRREGSSTNYGCLAGTVGAAIAFVAFLMLLIFSSCAEQREQPEITGAWNNLTYPSNYYLFYDGILEVHSTVGGQIVWEKWFAYYHNRETGALEVRDRNGLYFRGSVFFTPDSDTAYIEQEGGIRMTLARW